ncbi:MAG: AAA family ATPase [Planctomycetota bacterium]|nr:AAA family ATPase [Planctomycetota bacterium]
MQRTIQTLLLTHDPGLVTEFSAATDDLGEDVRFVLHVEEDERRTIRHATERPIDLLIVDLDQDISQAKRLAEELRGVDHPPVLVATYRRQEFDGDGALSSGLVELLRSGVRDFLSRPLSRPEVRELVDREILAGEEQSPRSVGKVLSFVGSKGGVGKSTVGINTAVGLSRSGSVLLVDASIQHGVAADLLGLQPEATLADAAREVERLDARLLAGLVTEHASGLHLLPAPSNAIDAAPVDEAVISRVISVGRRAYDYVVVDTFPLLDSVTLAILDLSHLTFTVLNDSGPTINGSAELLRVLERVGVDRSRSRVVLNRTHPGRGLGITPTDVATRLDRSVDHVVPYSKSVLSAANTGKPRSFSLNRMSAWQRAINRIVKDALTASTSLGQESDSAARPLGAATLEAANRGGAGDGA